MFPHKDFKQSHHFDGGAVQGVDIVNAINSCKNQGYAEESIDLDVINLGANSVEQTANDRKKTFGMLMRYLELNNYYRGAENLERGMHIFEKVNFRHIVVPHERLASGRLPMSFKKEEIQAMYD